MRKNDWRSSIWKLPVLSGTVLALAYFPFDLLLPNLFALLPMLYWLDHNQVIWRWQRFRACLIFGMTVHLIILHWMWAMLDISWLWIGAYFFTAIMLGLSIAISMALAGWIRARTGWTYALILPICWLPIEWLKTWGDSRMTADNLAHTLAGYPFLVQFADLLGPYGVGAFMLVAGALLYETIFCTEARKRWRHAGALIVLLAAVLGYDAWAWNRSLPTEGTVRIGVVQPNFSLDIKHDEDMTLFQWEALVEMTREAAREAPDLVVWPESAHPLPIQHWLDKPETFRAPLLENLARELDTDIITGVEYARARTRENFAWYNAAVIAHADGTLDPTWTAKTYLVPFTEQIPYEWALGPLLSGQTGELRWMAGGFTRPEKIRPLPFEKGPVGVLVCYEELYWDLARRNRNNGAVLQAVITNDAWFKQTKFQDYQADTVRLRAIENRSSFIRAANTGISGFVDPHGRYHVWTALDVAAVEVAELPIVTGRTVYNRIGDVVAWVAIAGLIAAVFLARGREREQ